MPYGERRWHGWRRSSRGSGLIGLTDRVEALGGTMAIVSPGTVVQLLRSSCH